MNNDKKNQKETNIKKTPNINVTENSPNLDIVFNALKKLSSTTSIKK